LTTLIPIVGDQLTRGLTTLRRVRKDDAALLMMEVAGASGQRGSRLQERHQCAFGILRTVGDLAS